MIRSRYSGDAKAKARRARRLLGQIPGKMEAIAGNAAYRLRQSDPYQDRTGDLRRSTKAELSVAGSGDAIIELVMGMYYATFVNRRGFTNFDQEALRATKRIRALIRRVRQKLHGN